jgi:hypothetical protein
MNLKKLKILIRECLQESYDSNNVLKNNQLGDKLKMDINFLNKGFNFDKFESNNNFNKWIFTFTSKGDTYKNIFSVINKNDIWFCKNEVYWLKEEDKITPNAGKDNELEFGPFNSYKEMVEEIDRKLNNNPILSTNNFEDDYVNGLNDEIVDLLKELQLKANNLYTFNNNKIDSKGSFDELLIIYNEIKDLKEEELKDFANNKWPNEEDKMTAILNLQNSKKDEFYKGMRQMGHI